MARLKALANQPELTIETDPSHTRCSVVARNLCPTFVTALDGCMEALLQVKVSDAGGLDDEDLPGILGDREILSDGVRFIPHFPLEPGVAFRAILDLRALGRSSLAKVHTLEFSLPKELGGADTKVSHVFPSSDALPENLLRLYVRFSNPMQRGQAADNIQILGPDATPAPNVLYRAPVELWDRSMTCLTILLDPGRLKRGVGPNRMLGPPLKVGQQYTLAISPGMTDVYGRPLHDDFNKSFSVSEAVSELIAIEKWKVLPPAIGSHEPLELTFPRPLDWAQLWHGITVASKADHPVSGRIDIDLDETRWRLTPDEPWQAGAHSIRVAPCLEDICGNTPFGPFDGPFRSAEEVALETAIRLIRFATSPNS